MRSWLAGVLAATLGGGAALAQAEPPQAITFSLKPAEASALIQALAKVPCSGDVQQWIVCSQVAQLISQLQVQLKEQAGK